VKIGIIGGGNMARAIVLGLLANKTKAETIMVSDISEKKLNEFRRYGVKTGTNEQVIKFSDTVIFAVKPNVFDIILHECVGADKLFVSIAAGMSVDYIKSFLGEDARVARVMPNTPALVGAGMTAVCGDTVSYKDLEIVKGIFETIGEVIVTEEKNMDAVCGVSGSGPAYAYTLIEAMADGGVLKGLPRQDAIKLAAQTVFGAAKMALETDTHPAQLRDAVCSPGGTTIEGVAALEKNGFRSAVISAVDAACEKSKLLKK
jgi:pyrroline-5-carboxylate reductase